MSDDRPTSGDEMRAEKQKMLADQARARERDRPMTDKRQAQCGRDLLARLEQIKPNGPARIAMHGPPASAFDEIPTRMPEPVGGCFSDLADTNRNEGAQDDDDEVPYG
jgi:hypothetical protein